MSFKTFLKAILTILLIISLILFILSITLYQFTLYKNLKPKITSLIEQEFSTQVKNIDLKEFEDFKKELIENCSGKEEAILPLDIKINNLEEITIKCSEINEKLTLERSINLISESFFETVYYKKYSCSFISCLNQEIKNENFLFLFSKKINSLFLLFFLIFTFTSLILILGLILLSKPKFIFLYNSSYAFLIAGSFFLIKFIFNKVLLNIIYPIRIIIMWLINDLSKNFLILFICGLILLIISLFIKFSKKKK